MASVLKTKKQIGVDPKWTGIDEIKALPERDLSVTILMN